MSKLTWWPYVDDNHKKGKIILYNYIIIYDTGWNDTGNHLHGETIGVQKGGPKKL